MLGKLFNTRRSYKKLKRQVEARNLASVIRGQEIDLVIDVGANVGQTGQSLRRHGYHGLIISFEPVKRCHDTLLELSARDPLWRIHELCAAGDRDGEIEIAVSRSSDLSSVSPPTAAMSQALPKVEAVERATVPVRRLDGLLGPELSAASHPLLKIDAQGHDMAVLRGASGIMERLRAVQIEMSLVRLYEGETLYLEMLNYLEERRFHAHILVERAFSETLGRQLQIDGVFVRGPQ